MSFSGGLRQPQTLRQIHNCKAEQVREKLILLILKNLVNPVYKGTRLKVRQDLQDFSGLTG
jgi:hypothetical protein